jgi:hypothetical protein
VDRRGERGEDAVVCSIVEADAADRIGLAEGRRGRRTTGRQWRRRRCRTLSPGVELREGIRSIVKPVIERATRRLVEAMVVVEEAGDPA